MEYVYPVNTAEVQSSEPGLAVSRFPVESESTQSRQFPAPVHSTATRLRTRGDAAGYAVCKESRLHR